MSPIATREGLLAFWTWWAGEVDAGRIHGVVSEPMRALLSSEAAGLNTILYPNPIQHPNLGYLANLLLNHPGLDKKVRDEGFDARLANMALKQNPYSQEGCYTWWREGWFNADDNLRSDPLPEEDAE